MEVLHFLHLIVIQPQPLTQPIQLREEASILLRHARGLVRGGGREYQMSAKERAEADGHGGQQDKDAALHGSIAA
jgi:hypothetical protein